MPFKTEIGIELTLPERITSHWLYSQRLAVIEISSSVGAVAEGAAEVVMECNLLTNNDTEMTWEVPGGRDVTSVSTYNKASSIKTCELDLTREYVSYPTDQIQVNLLWNVFYKLPFPPGTLTITNVTRDDAGEYVCKVANNRGHS